jgi:hypothetical protein
MKWVLKIDTLSERVQLSKEGGQEQPEMQVKFARPIPSYELRYVQITIAVPFKAGAPARVSTSSSAQEPARAWNLMLSASQALNLSFPFWFFAACKCCYGLSPFETSACPKSSTSKQECHHLRHTVVQAGGVHTRRGPSHGLVNQFLIPAAGRGGDSGSDGCAPLPALRSLSTCAGLHKCQANTIAEFAYLGVHCFTKYVSHDALPAVTLPPMF